MKRRKVGNLLGLAVLSAVVERPMHPYEMATVLKQRGKEADMPIKWGSIYTVVANLEKHGFLQSVGSARNGARPERTVYRITPAGRAEMEDWVRELVGSLDREPPRFKTGLSLMGVLGPDQAARLLRQRADDLDERAAAQRANLEQSRPVVPRIFLVEGEYELAMIQAEARWIRAFLSDLTSGAVPGTDAWRHWYETGEFPDDLEEFVQK